MLIRLAAVEDLGAFAEIERAAGESFRGIGMAEVADDEPFTLDELTPFQRAGRAWIATPGAGSPPIAYLLAEPVDGNVHIAQVSVHPRVAGRGIGRSLVDHLALDAAAAGVPALTLTTFAEVPWNAPYYLRFGFRVLGDAELTPGLRRIRRAEAAHGLDRWPRVCMRRDL
jgi:GNAT superfamily N-acetyltransferase